MMSKHWGPAGEIVGVPKNGYAAVLTKLLSTNGYILYNRLIAKKLGVEAAILLGYMCHLSEVYGNGFYCQQDRLIDDTALTEYAVKAATQKLVKSGVLNVEKKGLPAKNEYTILNDGIFYLLSGCENGSTSQVMAPVDSKSPDKTSINSIYNNEEDIESNKTKTKRFIVPSVEEVKAYCVERNNYVNAQQFVDFYSAKGWVVGKAPMKDWKAAVRTWEQHDSSRPNPVPREKPVVYDY